MPQGNTIGDVLDMGLGDEGWPHDFNFDEEQYDQMTRFERPIAFDILWDELGEYPRDLVEEDPVLSAICDDTDHHYMITLPHRESEVGASGIALYAWLDDDADVEVVEDE